MAAEDEPAACSVCFDDCGEGIDTPMQGFADLMEICWRRREAGLSQIAEGQGEARLSVSGDAWPRCFGRQSRLLGGQSSSIPDLRLRCSVWHPICVGLNIHVHLFTVVMGDAD